MQANGGRNEIDVVTRGKKQQDNILSQLSDSSNSTPDNLNNNMNVINNSVFSSSRISAELLSSTATMTNSKASGGEGDRNRLRRRNFSHENFSGMTRRCVCNLSQCASQNYMCKSERRILEDGQELEAGCFIEELVEGGSHGSESLPGSQHGVGVTESNGRVTSARRGCIEMLSREKQEMCSDHAGTPIQCCQKDMCNYPKAYYPPFTQNVHHNNNNKAVSFDSIGGGVQGVTPNMDHQVWLRAAVIAVPVCGIMILAVLIFVARRLLKSDEMDYKESSGRSNRNKPYNYPVPHPPHQHVKPVFLEPQEFLLPIENHCCCHNNSNNTSGEFPIPISGGFPKNPSTISAGETEELVNNIGQLSHCQCPSNLSDTGSFCSTTRPPSLLHYSPPIPHPKKFSLLAHFGLSRTSKDTNFNSNNNARIYDA